jgi:hypothetical protein
MSKKKYRPKLHLRGNKHAPADQPVNRESAFAEAFKRHGGERIDRDIARLEKLLEVHDVEVEKLLSGKSEKHRWLVSPSMVVRIQREIQELLQRRALAIESAERELALEEGAVVSPMSGLPMNVDHPVVEHMLNEWKKVDSADVRHDPALQSAGAS